ncbi:non-specific lipid transfer protein GPI-anchored 2-like [Panicum miliaceum]|uniref:Non-specific lipid transfer protein GPI-anchored 2-like n=1 Tax=Panicum miliaceum TaxID=4540 RepID=A0A3L6TDF9_PANMI|nr:non-specific lipid transfer protein GPI-anchored 2-like [Panicum miliaceum]
MGLKLNLTMRVLAVVAALAAPAAGQGGAASCTASLITSFTPCLNFLTNGGGGPGADAGLLPVPGGAGGREHRLRVPHPHRQRAARRARQPDARRHAAQGLRRRRRPAAVPRYAARASPDEMTGVDSCDVDCSIRRSRSRSRHDANPIRMLDAYTPAQIPAPGPVAGAPSAALPPLPQATPATPEPEAPAPPVVDPTGTAPISQGQTRPIVLPSSGRRASTHAPAAAALVLLLAAGAALL